MKTTIDLPDALVLRAKVIAAKRRTTLKKFFMEGLERVVNSPTAPGTNTNSQQSEEVSYEFDVYGIPVLKHRGVKLTDAMIEQMREKEGV